MRLIDRLYDWLSQGPTPDCDQILAAGLSRAEPHWAERIIRVLQLRGRDASWAALIGHYDQLTPAVCELLHGQSERMQAGIALALKSSSREARANALRALEQHPFLGMAYLLPYAIRDTSRTVRELAARTLHRMAGSFLEQPAPPADAEAEVLQAYDDQRSQLTLALDEALQAFDLHYRIEVLEACLWYSRELGESLWSRLTPHRSHAGTAVAQRVSDWDHPRLAHFLVSALKRPGWPQTVARVLQRWKTIPQLTALLRQDELLNDPGIRRNLNHVHSPHWFTGTGDDLAELEPELRRRASRWVRHTGYTDSERLALLSRWLRAPDAGLHSAAVHALAQIDSPDARSLLKQVAASNSSLASFAGWSVQAFDTEALNAALEREVPTVARSELDAQGEPSPQQQADADCAMVWRACRRTSPNARGELIALLRENAEIWRPRLTAYLHSDDPRDRVLALQVVSTARLAREFRSDLEPLRDDPVPGIRQLMGRLMDSLSQEPQPSNGWSPEAAGRGAPVDAQAVEQVRRELDVTLARLSTGEADATDAALIARVRGLLREAYWERSAVEPATATGEAE